MRGTIITYDLIDHHTDAARLSLVPNPVDVGGRVPIEGGRTARGAGGVT